LLFLLHQKNKTLSCLVFSGIAAPVSKIAPVSSYQPTVF